MFSQTSKDYLIALIRAQLRQETVPVLPADLNLQELYKLAKKHCVESIVYYALEQLTITDHDDLLATWAANRDGNLFKLMTQLGELERLSVIFEQQKIKHLPLKGSLLINLYPQFDYRYLGDLDILFEKGDIPRVFQQMEKDGYQPKDCDLVDVTEYFKDVEFWKEFNGVKINIEVHNDLLHKNSDYYSLFQNLWQTKELISLTSYRYNLTLEDFYVYHIVHLAKHYYNSGTGIRSIMDTYVFLIANQDKLNNTYINKKLDSVGLNQFRTDIEKVTMYFFNNQSLPEHLKEMVERLLSHGAYGDHDSFVTNLVENVMVRENKSRLGYLFSRVFLPYFKMIRMYPILKKHSYLLPYFWAHRLVRVFFDKTRMKNLIQELSYLKNFNE